MSVAEMPTPDPRIAELVRVNAELAGEVRRLRLGGEAASVSGPLPASRRLASLLAERDSLAARLEATGAELGSVKAELDRLVGHNHELAEEVRRLRGGRLGAARRVWARLRLR